MFMIFVKILHYENLNNPNRISSFIHFRNELVGDSDRMIAMIQSTTVSQYKNIIKLKKCLKNIKFLIQLFLLPKSNPCS